MYRNLKICSWGTAEDFYWDRVRKYGWKKEEKKKLAKDRATRLNTWEEGRKV
jgi:hypothetical protein